MKTKYKLQAKKRVAKRYALQHREIYTLSAIAALVFGVLVIV